MAYEGWLEYNGVEIANLARTARLARAASASQVALQPKDYDWILESLGEDPNDANDITNAPWFKATNPASAEFLGFIPLSVEGISDSTREASTTQSAYDGGKTGRSRAATKSFVVDGFFTATSARGAEYGRRWMEGQLNPTDSRSCVGAELWFFKYGGRYEDISGFGGYGNGPFGLNPFGVTSAIPLGRVRDVSLTRGVRVTNQLDRPCFSATRATFTLTADNPYTYGEQIHAITSANVDPATGPLVVDSEMEYDLFEVPCPTYDYAPLVDPQFNSLVDPPPVPVYIPDFWGIVSGDKYRRQIVEIDTSLLEAERYVPVISISSSSQARRFRVSIWASEQDADLNCGALFTVTANYIPNGATKKIVVDGVREFSFFEDPGAATERRADSTTFGDRNAPVRWASFPPGSSLFVTVDNFYVKPGETDLEGNGNVRVSLDLVSRED